MDLNWQMGFAEDHSSCNHNWHTDYHKDST